MPRDVDVAGLGRRGTELTGEMGLDDSGRPLGADERCLVDGTLRRPSIQGETA